MKNYIYSIVLLCTLLVTSMDYAFASEPVNPIKDSLIANDKEFDEAFIYEEAKRIGLNPVEATYYVQNIKASYLGQKYHYDAIATVANQMATTSSGSSCNYDLENNTANPFPFYSTPPAPWSGTVFNATDSSQSQTRIVKGRHTLTFKNPDNIMLDPIGKFPIVAPNWSKDPAGINHVSMRLGNRMVGGEAESVKVDISIDNTNPLNRFITYAYALVLQDPSAIVGAPSHPPSTKPYFQVRVKIKNQAYSSCGGLKVIAGSDLVGYSYTQGGAYVYKPWTQNIIDCTLLPGYNPTSTAFVVELEFITADCTLGGHFGYGYVDVACTSPTITRKGSSCKGGYSTFNTKLLGNYRTEQVLWEFLDSEGEPLGSVSGTVKTSESGEKSYIDYLQTVVTPGTITFGPLSTIEAPQVAINQIGTLTVRVAVTQVGAGGSPSSNCGLTLDYEYEITDCSPRLVKCKECITSFAPIPGNKYVLSAWVREETTQPISYSEPGITVYLSGPGATLNFTPKGKIIDGWQKIEEEFWVPEGTHAIEVTLKNTSTTSTQYVYFDDIRIHPFKANMKSYVYDPFTQKLMAELDENNFATYYEYDEEGGLKRVKKETERGVMTIKENGSNQAR